MPTISAQHLKKKLDEEKVLIIDVREPSEYADWHIPGAINIPVSRVMKAGIDVPKGSEIIAVCLHGMRSAAATRYLQMAGFENVYSLEGGMVEWNGIYDTVRISENIVQVRRIGKGCLSYVLVSDGEAVIIDPTVDIDVFVEAADGSKIVAALDTHAHADHASGGRLLAKRGIPYYAPAEVGIGSAIKDGDEISFGSLSLVALASPGHTPGSLCYRFGRFLFTGDTLFVDAVGRPDLGQNAEENAPVLFKTIQKLLKMPDETVILPAHTEVDNLKSEVPVKELMEEIRELPLLKKSEGEFVLWIASANRPAPENFELLRQYNQGKIAVDTLEEFRELEAGANRCGLK